MYAIFDPNWGEAKVIPETVCHSEEEAWSAACYLMDHSLYSGYSQFPLPNGTKGIPERLKKAGYVCKKYGIGPLPVFPNLYKLLMYIRENGGVYSGKIPPQIDAALDAGLVHAVNRRGHYIVDVSHKGNEFLAFVDWQNPDFTN